MIHFMLHAINILSIQSFSSSHHDFTNTLKQSFLRDSPAYIEGFLRSWDQLKINIQVTKQNLHSAKYYIDKHVTSVFPEMDSITFEYTIVKGNSIYLGRNGQKKELSNTEKLIQSGSLVGTMQSSDYRSCTENLNCHPNANDGKFKISENTIACFMYCLNNGHTNDLWGITAGHGFCRDSSNTAVNEQEQLLISAYGPNPTSKNICVLSHTFFYDLIDFDYGDGPKTVDMAIFLVESSKQESPSVDTRIPGISNNGKQKVFTGDDVELLHRKVVKKGMYSEGII